MTENEAIKILEEEYKSMSMCANMEQCKKHNEAISMAIDALKKVKQYRNGGY